MSNEYTMSKFASKDHMIEAMQEEIAELRGLKELHHRTISLVFPGERDSPGAYMKILRDTNKALSVSQEQVAHLLKENFKLKGEVRDYQEEVSHQWAWLKSVRIGIAKCAYDTETHFGCRGCGEDLARLDAFLEKNK